MTDLVELTSTIQYTNNDPSQVQELIEQDLPRFLDLFLTRSREYGDDNKFVLGSRGQFADMWRKFGKLKTGIWEGNEAQLTSEGVDEILIDLIGHCFLTLQCRRAEGAQGKGFRGEEEDPDVIARAKEDAEDSLKSPGYECWSSDELAREVRKRDMVIPSYVLRLLGDDQLRELLRRGDMLRTDRHWDRIVSGERRAHDGQPSYDLTDEDEA